MRLFVALEIPAQVLDEVAVFRAEVEGLWPRARWVRVDGIHLTLSFLGETPPASLPALEGGLAVVAARHARLPLAVRGGGTFPPRGPARVAWLGVESGATLIALQAGVAAASGEPLGLAAETRPFNPHLTLARPQPPWPRERAEAFAAAADRPFGPPFEVERMVLLESHLGRGGSRYEMRAAWPLGAPEAAGARLGDEP